MRACASQFCAHYLAFSCIDLQEFKNIGRAFLAMVEWAHGEMLILDRVRVIRIENQ